MDTNVFNEILASYEISSNYRRKSSASAHWKRFFHNDYNKNFTKEKIINFRNNGLSDGLDNRRHGNLTDLNNEFEKLILFLRESGIEYEDIKHLFPSKNTGNLQITLKNNDKFIDDKFIKLIRYYLLFKKIIFKKSFLNHQNINILDIGGGFGGLISVFIRGNILKNNNVKYFLIDLPEANLLSNYFLSEQFPDKRIFNLQKKNVIKETLSIDDLSIFDIFILPTNSNISKEIKFNFINNTASMMEMEYEEISNYFKLIQSNLNINGYFANLNRYYKDTANEKIYFHKYPYDDFWEICYSKPQGKRSHFFITKRIENKKNEINLEMKKLSLIAKNHAPPSFIPLQIYNLYRSVKKRFKQKKI